MTCCIPESALYELIVPMQREIDQAGESGNLRHRADLQQRLATMYFHFGDIQAAKDLLEDSLRTFTLIHDYASTAFDYQLLADIHIALNDYTAAQRYARQALFITDEYHISEIQIHVLEVLSRLAIYDQDFELAQEYISQALNLVQPSSYALFWLYVVQGRILMHSDINAAFEWGQKAIDTLSKHVCSYDKAYTLENLAELHIQAGSYEKAGEYLEQAYEKSDRCHMLRYSIVSAQIRLYSLLGNSKEENEKIVEQQELCRINNYTWLISEEAKPDQSVKDEALFSINTLGHFSIRCGNTEISIKRSSSNQLLLFLLVNRNRWINREIIIEELFADYSSNPDNYFYVALSSLRKAMKTGPSGDANIILRDRDCYRLNTDILVVDADRFTELCSIAAKSGAVSFLTPALEADSLYADDFLAEYPYDEYLGEERDRLQTEHNALLRKLAHFYKANRQYLKSVEYSQKLIAADHFDESAYLDLCDTLLIINSVHQARRCAKEMIRNIEDNLGVPCHDQLKQVFVKHGIRFDPADLPQL
jgi:DNA-binding SARP family transcriptional activator/Tfp pilus assembly protein PilF